MQIHKHDFECIADSVEGVSFYGTYEPRGGGDRRLGRRRVDVLQDPAPPQRKDSSMKRIWKYLLDAEEGNDEEILCRVEIPKGAIVRHLGMQDERPHIWVEVEPDNAIEVREFSIFPTGVDIDHAYQRYIGTFVLPGIPLGSFGTLGDTVWHVYE
jgi:hypothetical protein